MCPQHDEHQLKSNHNLHTVDTQYENDSGCQFNILPLIAGVEWNLKSEQQMQKQQIKAQQTIWPELKDS